MADVDEEPAQIQLRNNYTSQQQPGMNQTQSFIEFSYDEHVSLMSIKK